MYTFLSFLSNLIIVVCELYALGHIKRKWEILKYYTYLQNLIALITSAVFITAVLWGEKIPELVKGLRYISACGLIATMFIFIVFLGAGKKLALTEDDFLPGCKPTTANTILHYLCPALSLLSFLVFERDFVLSHGIWTTIVALPSGVYWIIYAILSAVKAWEAPYDFTSSNKKSTIGEVLSYILIPLSFVAISFMLWNLK